MRLDEDKLYDLVAQWDESRQCGGEIPLEELCSVCPELLLPLKERIASIIATDWLEDEKAPLAETVSLTSSDTVVVPDFWTVDSLSEAIVEAEVLEREHLDNLRDTSGLSDVKAFARMLVERGALTHLQLSSILKGRSEELVLGNYHLLDVLGSGGMGTVYKARHRLMNRVVALKIVSKSHFNSRFAVERFRREIEAIAMLNHENIVTAYDADEADGQHFLVMEYVEGQDVQAVVDGYGPLPLEQAVDAILQAAKALEYAHCRGIIHRDIKPRNLLLDRNGSIKILDLGLASIDSPDQIEPEITNTGNVLGTVDYMAPEQAVSTRDADARSDIYSLGIALWYLLTGKPAYEGDSMMARLLAHREASIPSLRTACPDVPEVLEAVFRKMAAKKPEDRYQSMAEVVVDLQRCLDGFHSGDDRLAAAVSANAPTRIFQPGESTSSEPVSSETVIFSNALAKTDPETAALPPSEAGDSAHASRPRQFFFVIGGLLAAVLLGVFLRGIVIRIVHKDGTTEEIEVPEDARRVEIVQEAAGGPVAPPLPKPISRFALEFDGNDVVSVPSLKFENQEELTFELFVDAADHRLFGAQLLKMEPFNMFVQFAHAPESGFMQGISIGDARRAPPGRAKLYKMLSRERVHVAGVIDAKTVKLFVDGQLVAKHVNRIRDPNKTKGNDREAVEHLCLGGRLRQDGSITWGHHGTIDELRISSVARYEEDFQPQQHFEPDEQTLVLYHFDEGSGKILEDSSGNGHDGKIIGAKWVRWEEAVANPPNAPHSRRWARPLPRLIPPPEEAAKMTPAELFQRLDRNNNGTLDTAEIPPHVVTRADNNSDGQVSREEFFNAAKQENDLLGPPHRNR